MPTVQRLLETMNPDTIELQPVETFQEYTSIGLSIVSVVIGKAAQSIASPYQNVHHHS